MSTDESFATVAIDRTGKNMLAATAWKADSRLNYAATYFWKVRAIGDKTSSAWSSVSAFTTESAPVASPSPAPSPASPLPARTSNSPSPTTSIPVATPTPSGLANAATTPVAPFFPGWMMYIFGVLLVAVVALVVTVVVMLVMKMRRGS